MTTGEALGLQFPWLGGFDELWNRAVIAAGVPRLAGYCGRHSFASALIHEGRSIVEVAEQFGRSDASTTLRHYAHIVEEARDGDRISLAESVEDARSDATKLRDSCVVPSRRHLRLVS